MVSTIIATLFLRTTLHANSVSDGQTYLGLIFFAIIHMVRPEPYSAISVAAGASNTFNCFVCNDHFSCAGGRVPRSRRSQERSG